LNRNGERKRSVFLLEKSKRKKEKKKRRRREEEEKKTAENQRWSKTNERKTLVSFRASTKGRRREEEKGTDVTGE